MIVYVPLGTCAGEWEWLSSHGYALARHRGRANVLREASADRDLLRGWFMVMIDARSSTWRCRSLARDSARRCPGCSGLVDGYTVVFAGLLLSTGWLGDRLGGKRVFQSGLVLFILALGSGPLVGGVLVSSLGWRWIFFVNVPVGIAGKVLTARWVHAGPGGRSGERLDVPGHATGMVALLAITAGMVYGVTPRTTRATARAASPGTCGTSGRCAAHQP